MFLSLIKIKKIKENKELSTKMKRDDLCKYVIIVEDDDTDQNQKDILWGLLDLNFQI